MIVRTLLIIAAVLALLPLRQDTAWAGGPLKLAELLSEAEKESPELSALQSRYHAAYERVPQASALDDPMLSLGFSNVPVDSFAFDRDGMTMKEIGLSQKVPFFGKRELRGRAALLDARSMQAEYQDRLLMHHAEIKMVYYELYSIKKGIEIVEKNMELMGVFKKTAESNYAVGRGMIKDALKAQVELSMLLDKKLELQREDRTKRAYLGSMVGRHEPVTGEVEDITPTEIKLDRDALAKSALNNRPAVRAAEAREQKGSAMLELARKDYYPDFEFSARYGQREELKWGMDQPDMVSAMITINLPVWWKSKLGPGVSAAATDRAAAESEREAIETEIYYKVDSLISEVEQDGRIMKLYKDAVIPQATEDLNSAVAGYEVGKADFLTLLESRRTLYDYELGYYMALAEREKAVAELEAAVGAGLYCVDEKAKGGLLRRGH